MKHVMLRPFRKLNAWVRTNPREALLIVIIFGRQYFRARLEYVRIPVL
jgi:hypothetical protein